MLSIDFNCDLGESYGSYSFGNDERIMDFVSSVNIACGFHAGDASVMRKTVSMALSKGVAIGAHPGFPDLQGLGRRVMNLSCQEIYDIVMYQVGALMAFAIAFGTKLNHVKPHGALYNMGAKDPAVAKSISQAVYDVDKNLVFYGLSGSCLVSAAKTVGLKTASEVFADRSYSDDGFLTERKEKNAFIKDPNDSAKRVLQMVKKGTVTSINGKEVKVVPETICIHGDSEDATQFAKCIRQVLQENSILIKAPLPL